MKKSFLWVFAMLLIMASCSSDELVNNVPLDGDGIETKSALDKIFTVEKVTDGDVGYPSLRQNIMWEDSSGDFYYYSRSEGSTGEAGDLIIKYDAKTKSTSTSFQLPAAIGITIESFCFDNLKNLYCIVDAAKFLKITPDKSIIDLTDQLPKGNSSTHLYGLSVAGNGNVFINCTVYRYKDAIGIEHRYRDFLCRISPQGKVTEILSDMNIYSNRLASVVKPSGGSVYIVHIECDGTYLKTDVTTKVLDTIKINTPNMEWITAAQSKPNPFGLSKRKVYQLRPNMKTDLLIGTIPNYVTNESGELVQLNIDGYLYANADASAFYLLMREEGSFYKQNIYKLTLE